jgi:hypothetical protein
VEPRVVFGRRDDFVDLAVKGVEEDVSEDGAGVIVL